MTDAIGGVSEADASAALSLGGSGNNLIIRPPTPKDGQTLSSGPRGTNLTAVLVVVREHPSVVDESGMSPLTPPGSPFEGELVDDELSRPCSS